MPIAEASEDGDRSDQVNSSTIASRCGSASAEWTAARSDNASTVIASIYVEISTHVKLGVVAPWPSQGDDHPAPIQQQPDGQHPSFISVPPPSRSGPRYDIHRHRSIYAYRLPYVSMSVNMSR